MSSTSLTGFCSSRGSYHGGSPQTMGLTSNAAYKYPIANGLGCTNVRIRFVHLNITPKKEVNRSLIDTSHITADVCECPYKVTVAVRFIQLTRFLPTKQTMCPDVFRGPWGGSRCRDSPVQTIRDCSCAEGTTKHMRLRLNARKTGLRSGRWRSVMQQKALLFFCTFYLEWTLACLCKSFNTKIWLNFDWLNFDWKIHHPRPAKSNKNQS